MADRQHGVVALRQLLELGYSARSSQRRVERGVLHRLFPGVYAVGHTRLTVYGRWMAAVLACGETAALSHAAGAALHALRGVPSGAIDVTSAGRRRLQGVRAHPRDLVAIATTTVDAIPVTTIEQTIVDLAPRTPAQRLRTTIENGMRRDAIDFAVLRALAVARAGRPGIPRLTAVLGELDDVAPRSHAGLEQLALELLRAHPEIPEPVANAVVVGFEVDLHWPVQRVIVELDGWAFHRDRRTFEADRRRDAALLAAGWRVLRITHERLVGEPDRVLGELRALLDAQRAA